MENIELLKKLYSIHSPSGREKKMRKFILNYCRQIPDTVVTTDHVGNVYVCRGTSQKTDTDPSSQKFYPCVVSHIDQVQTVHSHDFVALDNNGVILGWSPSKREQQGLGADDKNGIWIALQCLTMYPTMKAAFFVGEEVGCVGSSQCNMQFFEDCGYVLQCDRRGHADLITEIGGTTLCSQEFVDAITPSAYGYAPTHGAMTDVEELKGRGLGVCCCNMSCGYYHPHTDHELTDINDLSNCFAFVRHIIETLGETRWESAAPVDEWDDYDDWYGYPSNQKTYIGSTPSNQKTDKHWLYDLMLQEATYEMIDMAQRYPKMTYDEVYDVITSFYPELTGEDFDNLYWSCFDPKGETYYA